jgi:UDP-N-acetylglucosamine 2-epimerase (non-hydrolysing)
VNKIIANYQFNSCRPVKVACIFGTRPELIKMVPVIRELRVRPDRFDVTNLVSWQHDDLLRPLLDSFGISVDLELGLTRERRSLDELVARLLGELNPALARLNPDVVLVQGDTATAFAGALSAHHQHIPVVHIEAGLRSGNRYSPFPEEMYRQMITRLATYHMAATPANVATLRTEAVPEENIFLTGNPVVDAIKSVLEKTEPSDETRALIDRLRGLRTVVLTTHRRENFGPVMRTHLAILRDFVQSHDDLALVFPVHPNPAVRAECEKLAMSGPRIHLVAPMLYPDFIHLLNSAWLVASDSGGVQEEIPTLRKPLLVLRENTERPEVIASGFARLVGSQPQLLAGMLKEVYEGGPWLRTIQSADNPFGDGKSGVRIVNAISEVLLKDSEERLLA